jgi:hypothetical protein
LEIVIALLVAFLLSAGAVSLIAGARGRDSGLWLLYAVALLPIAFLHALSLHPNREARDRESREAGDQPCRVCAEYMRRQALICPHCGAAREALLGPPPAARAVTPLRRRRGAS